MAFNKEQLQNSAVADLFAINYCQLCEISYAPPSKICSLVPTVKPLGQGAWQCIWGPTWDAEDANLVFIASYMEDRIPVLAAVVIRGTDVDISDIWSTLIQVFEDLFIPIQSQVPWLINSSAHVADGTLDALWTIQNLSYQSPNGQQTTILQFLTTYLSAPENNAPVLVVTGHSLGGCLTTVVAPWLQESLSAANVRNPIVPTTFAAPTAGNAAFATYFADHFAYAPRYCNSLDVVPDAWWSLEALDSIYKPCGVSTPDAVKLGAWIFDEIMAKAGVTYSQPQMNMAPLKGTSLKGTPDWYEQGMHQHHVATYLNLLGGASITDERLTPVRPRRNRRRPDAPAVDACLKRGSR
jgi:triacylglycerol lipase